MVGCMESSSGFVGAGQSAARAVMAVLVLPCVLLVAQDAPSETLKSGPPKGRKLTELRVVDVVGHNAGQERDGAAEMQRGPAAILFLHEISRNVAPLLRGFDQAAADLRVLGLRTLCVRLDADRTHAEQHTPQVVQSLRMARPMVVSVDGAEGPGNYALHRKATATLVLAFDGVVQGSMAFTDTGEMDVPMVEFLLADLVGGAVRSESALRAAIERTLPTDRAELVALLMDMEKERRRLVGELQAAEQRAAAARSGQQMGPGAGAPMRPAADQPVRGQMPQELLSLLAPLRQADTTADTAHAALASLDRVLERRPEWRLPAVQLLTRMHRETMLNSDTRSRVEAWLEASRR